MKRKLALITFAILSLIVAAPVLINSRRNLSPIHLPSSTRSYQVQGLIRGLDPAAKTIRISHEEIPNYMPAMTMSLPVKDTSRFKNLAAGDEVQFELVVTERDSWIAHIEKIRSDNAVTQTADAPAPSLEQLESESLRPGESLPDFTFTDQHGQLIHFKDFRGKVVLLTFIYTRCPLPNFCPLMTKNFSELEQRLSKEFPNKFQLLSISMDQEFDRPEVLKEYAERYAANPKDWTFGTPDSDSLKFLAGLMGLYFQKENGLISHDLRTALFGADGRLVQLWKSNVWTPYEVQRSVRETLTGHSDLAAR